MAKKIRCGDLVRERGCEGDNACPVAQTCSLTMIFTRVFTRRFCKFSSPRWVCPTEIWALKCEAQPLQSDSATERGRERETEGGERGVIASSISTLLFSGRQSQQWSKSGQGSRRRRRRRWRAAKGLRGSEGRGALLLAPSPPTQTQSPSH